MKIIFILIFTVFVFNSINANPLRGRHPHGSPITIQHTDENNNNIVNYEALQSLFLHNDVKNRKIVAVSIAGAFRKGKSFFLDYCLRFLYANYRSIDTREGNNLLMSDWNKDENEPLSGFSWKHGSKADTSGILIWSDVFLYDAENGEKIAIVLTDTQGLFEPSKPAIENSRIFGLSCLISSVQIYNLMEVVQENELEYLEMTIEFAKFIAGRANNQKFANLKPFQNLLFLIRDWSDEDFEFGYEGGEKYLLDDVLNPSNTGSNAAAQSVRENIHKSFDSVKGFLLPHPGSIIKKKALDGSWKQLNNEFVRELEKLIESLFKPENLTKKKVFNREVTGEDYYEHIFAYFKGFENENGLPEISTLYKMTVNRQMIVLIDDFMVEYKTEIDKILDFDDEQLEGKLNGIHDGVKAKIVLKFINTPKVGDDDVEMMEKYKTLLTERLDKTFIDFRRDILRTFEEKKRTKETIRQLNLNHEQEKAMIEAKAQELQRKLAEDFKEKLESEKSSRRAFEQQILASFMLNNLSEQFGAKLPEWARTALGFAALLPMITSDHPDIVQDAMKFFTDKFGKKEETTTTETYQ